MLDRPGISRAQRGQVTVEYFLLLTAIALLTLLAVANFDDTVQGSLQDFVGAAAERIGTQQ